MLQAATERLDRAVHAMNLWTMRLQVLGTIHKLGGKKEAFEDQYHDKAWKPGSHG
jgi:hypothetical protein